MQWHSATAPWRLELLLPPLSRAKACVGHVLQHVPAFACAFKSRTAPRVGKPLFTRQGAQRMIMLLYHCKQVRSRYVYILSYTGTATTHGCCTRGVQQLQEKNAANARCSARFGPPPGRPPSPAPTRHLPWPRSQRPKSAAPTQLPPNLPNIGTPLTSARPSWHSRTPRRIMFACVLLRTAAPTPPPLPALGQSQPPPPSAHTLVTMMSHGQAKARVAPGTAHTADQPSTSLTL